MRFFLIAVLVGSTLWPLTPCLAQSNAAKPGQDFRLRCELSLDKKQYEISEPIEAAVRLTNASKKVLSVQSGFEETGRTSGYNFVIRNADNKIISDPMHKEIWLMHSLGGEVQIESGKNDTRKLRLNYRTNPLMPGKYQVTAIYQSLFEKATCGESEPVEFEILDTSPAAQRARVDQLLLQIERSPEPSALIPLLGFTGREEAIAPLVNLTYSENGRARVAAVQALGYLDQAQVKEALLAALEKRGPSDRMIHYLVVSLKADPERVLPLLVRALDDGDAQKRRTALDGISWINRNSDETLLPKLISMLRDENASMRQRAAAAVGAFANAAALDALSDATNDTDSNVREQAAIAVGWIASTEKSAPPVRASAIEKLLSLLKGNDSAAQSVPYWLAKIKNEGAIFALKERLKTAPEGRLKIEILRALKIKFD